MTHKAVNHTAPEYLCDLIRLNVKSTTIRTRASFDPCLLCVPPISVLIHSLIVLLCILLHHCGMPLIYIFDYCPLILSKKSQDTSLSEVLCKLILIVFILFVLYLCFYTVRVLSRYCDYCVYHYKSTELVSLYTLDIGL